MRLVVTKGDSTAGADVGIHAVPIRNLERFSFWFQLLNFSIGQHSALLQATKYRQPENGLFCTPFLNEISGFGAKKYRHNHRTR